MNEPRDQHDDFRQLFADATSDIRPQGSLDDILERSKKVDPMTRRWFLPVVAAAAVIGFVIGGAVWLTNDSDSSRTTPGPAGTPTGSPTTGSTQPLTKELPIFYIGDTPAGPRLFTELTPVQGAEGERGPTYALGAAERALEGNPSDGDYGSAWPTSVKIDGLGQSGDSSAAITVYFSNDSVTERPAGMSAEVARLSIEQLVRTVQAAADSHAPVEFQVVVDYPDGTTGTGDGGPLDTVLGVPIDRSYTPGPDDEILAPVQITSPGDGTTVKAGDLTVTGMAATFEANVLWELKSGGDAGTDAVVQSGHTTAQECCTLSPYSFTIKNVPPGSYTLVVHDEDMSGEGKPVDQDTKAIVVQ